ncbi:putative nucleotide-diphospho-sugar transferase [Septoria linicola]|nr:putative nucleotide-diphospho-sugar transferase [Septoria linicola]
MVSWYYVAVFAWLFRYLRLVVNCISHWTFRPIPIPEHPSYTSQDVTIILPTIATGGDELRDTIETCLKSEPYELLLVTIDANAASLMKLANRINPKKIRVLSIREANKRRQMCRAIPEVVTKITIFVDDDVVWPQKVLPWMLAPFEDAKVGGVGTSQRLKRPENMSGYIFLGFCYLERRNFDCSACLNIDGGLPCLSGRTVAYRSDILQDEAFTHGFTHETWRKNQLNADDDNFITRWLYSHGWKIKMQYHKEFNACAGYAATGVAISRVYSWSATTGTLNHGAHILTYLFTFLILWTYGFSKTVKLWGHFFRYPVDVIYLPLYIAFGYFHGCIKAYGMLTLSQTTWGSRDGADTDNRVRMIKLPSYDSTQFQEVDGRKSESFDYPPGPHTQMLEADQLPAYDAHTRHNPVPLTTTNTNTYHD